MIAFIREHWFGIYFFVALAIGCYGKAQLNKNKNLAGDLEIQHRALATVAVLWPLAVPLILFTVAANVYQNWKDGV